MKNNEHEAMVNPRTLTALVCGAIALAVVTNAFAIGEREVGEEETFARTAKRGALGALWTYAAYSALQGRETHMTRPHVAVWKIAHGAFTMYLLALVFLLFQTKDGAQKTLAFFWSDLGAPLPKKSYGVDCRIYTPGHRSGPFGVVYETCFEVFSLAHVLGWLGKAIAIRDSRLLWAYSIAFELSELTFEHWQPNFNECWWDMWIWDVLICNWLGIAIGMALMKFMQGKMYDWSGKTKTRGRQSSPTSSASSAKTNTGVVGASGVGARGKLRRALMVFTPASLDKYTWRPTESPSRFMKCAFLVACGLAFDLNSFFLKHVLWMPATHVATNLRLVLWFAMSNMAIREYYVFIESPDMGAAKLGSNAWLALAVLVVEVLVVVKNSKGEFTNPWPQHIVRAWSVVFVCTAVYLIQWQRRLNREAVHGRSKAPARATRASSTSAK